jgi:conjugal transfer pilus assembly protein TraW
MRSPSSQQSKAILCLWIWVLLQSSGALAEEAWLEKSRAILEESRQRPLPDWLREAMEPPSDISGIQKPNPRHWGLSPNPSPNPKNPTTAILVSFSLGPETLKAIFHENRGHQDRVIVFRGLPEGHSFKDFVGGLRSLLQGLDRHEIPPITIDPERFSRFGVTRVPVLIREEPEGNATIVRGISQVDGIERQVSLGHGGQDLGVHGKTVEVSEPDLMETVKQRGRTFDWAQYQHAVQGDFWLKVPFESLPEAQKDREYRIDPTFTASRDIRDGQGRLIVMAGQKANPLDTLPFHQTLIVFNPMRPQEIRWIKAFIPSEPHRRLTLMATHVDRSRGWKGFEDLQKQIGSRVFLLTPDIRKRFRLSATPAVIDAEGRAFRIREIAMEVQR